MSSWEKLSSGDFGDISNIISIDGHRFIAASIHNESSTDDGIYEYNINSNIWHKSISITSKPDCAMPFIEYNPLTQHIWMIGDQTESNTSDIFEISIDSFNIIHHNAYIGETPSILFINGKYHVIGGSDNRYHLIWNDEIKQFEQKHKFKELQAGNLGHGVVYRQSKDEILMFGGHDWRCSNSFDFIYKYSITDGIWEMVKDLKLPVAMHQFGYILSNDEKYIVMFGGRDSGGSKYMDSIYVWDIDQMTINLSTIKCPKVSTFFATLMSNKQNDDRLVFGYLREKCKQSKVLLPDDILRMIANWISEETVYLITRYGDRWHWKIPLNDIIGSLA